MHRAPTLDLAKAPLRPLVYHKGAAGARERRKNMKRSNGTGTIVKLSGNRRRPYCVRVPGRDKHGYVIQVSLSYHAKMAEAQQALDEYNKQKAAGAVPATDKLSMTVGQVYEAWAGPNNRRRTASATRLGRISWTKRLSRFAQVKMRDMSVDDWQSVLDESEESGLSQSTINNDAALIHHLNSYAMERDIIVKDYSEFIEIPNVGPKYEKGSLSDLQIKQLEQMAADGVPWADTVLMLCYTGFRISEFLTLTPFNYHVEGGIPYFQHGSKTAAGRDRLVPIHPKIQPYVDRWLAKGGDTIICDDAGTPITDGHYRHQIFPSIVKALGLPQATPHWCRHTFATRTKTAGVDDFARHRILGHADQNITDHYTHENIPWLSQELQKVV